MDIARRHAPAPSQKKEAAGVAAVHLSAGLIAGVVASALFAWIWDQVEDRDPGADWLDRTVSAALHAHQAPWLTAVAAVLAQMGGISAMAWVAVAAAAAGAAWPRLRALAWSIPIVVAGAGALVEIAKLIFERPRPTYYAPLLKATGYSFPSGHSLVAMALYGFVGYHIYTVTRSRIRRIAAVVSTAALIVAIGLSRIYVGVHYPTDVLAGWTAGIPWLIACVHMHKALALRWPAAVDPTGRSTSHALAANATGSPRRRRR